MPEFLQSEFLTPFDHVSLGASAARMVGAVLLGSLIGWERELHEKAAGLRTHMLVSLAACLFTLISFDLLTVPAGEDDLIKVDPMRLIEAVTSGVAFLAAGMIFTSGGQVRGLTTGAGMWLAGAVGLACGIGNFVLAAMATGLAVIILWVLRRVPSKESDTTG